MSTSQKNATMQSTSLELPHCLELLSWHYQPVLSWYLHQPESHQLSLTKRLSLTHGLTTGPNYKWSKHAFHGTAF